MSTSSIRILLSVLFSIACTFSVAQNEASIWYFGNGQGLNFTTTPPQKLNDAPTSSLNSAGGIASTADANGNLILYTDSRAVYNDLDEVIENGNDLLGLGVNQVIIPKPGSNNQYYIFYVGSRNPNQWAYEVMYCVVDMNSNSGKGTVIEKNITLYAALHGSFTISGSCGANEYWLVGEADRNVLEVTDKLYAFRIDTNGISDKVVSSPVNIGNSHGYRFSPDGKKIFFFYSGYLWEEGSVVADFDRGTGIISNPVQVGPCCGYAEFSSDSRFLYVNYHTISPPVMKQYDLNEPLVPGVSIAELSIGFSGLQLAPDGKIYMIEIAPNGTKTLAVINSPSLPGQDCNLTRGDTFINNYIGVIHLPSFPTNLLYQDSLHADAGEDKEVCAGESIVIGGINFPGQNYKWMPEAYLSDPHLNNPTFNFTTSNQTSTVLKYTLTDLDDACSRPDTVNIVVHPKPTPVIYGSRSVCPGVVEVVYWTDHKSGYSYQWAVEGGTIVNGSVSDTIKINWGPTNPNAKVKLVATSEFNCTSEEVIFPVRINVELDTETPKGPLNVCINLRNDNVYQIGNTNGSIYTWGIEGGMIKQGQGSSAVKVDWFEGGQNKLWVTEQSTTIDTVCYGSSDTIKVKVYTDTLQAIIHAVTVNPYDDSKTSISGTLVNLPQSFSSPVTIFRRTADENVWTPFKVENASLNLPFSYEDIDLNTDNSIYEYQVNTVNGCQLDVSSVAHHTIQLHASGEEASGKITLHWNNYEGWPEGVERYEIWRKIDTDSIFRYTSGVDSQTISAELADGDKGFTHHLMIKAIARNRDFHSWSNQQEVIFEHQLYIPNVFTPNNDRVNETFEISHVDLYQQNELVIYNRYGTEVYREKNYKGDWRAEDLSTGVYYYSFITPGSGKELKGWLHILR